MLDMSRVQDLRTQAKTLYEQADNTEDREQRFELILEAMVLECEVDSLEWEDVRPSSQQEAPQRAVQQQQQQQPDDDKKE
jgi:hypothetical protein